MEEFNLVSTGGRDNFLKRNRANRQNAMASIRKQRQIISLQNNIRNFLFFKSLKNYFSHQQSMELQNCHLRDLNLKYLWVINSSDLNDIKLRELVIRFWIILQDQKNFTQQNVLQHLHLISRLGSLLVHLVIYFSHQLNGRGRIILTLTKYLSKFKIQLESLQFQLLLQNLMKEQLSSFNLSQVVDLCLVKKYKSSACNILNKDINFLLRALSHLLKCQQNQKIINLLSLYYEDEDKKELQVIERQQLKNININLVIQIYQNVSFIIMSQSNHKFLFLYISLMQQLLNMIQQMQLKTVQQKYSSTLHLFKDKKEFQQYLYQKQEWIELKQILSLRNLQAAQQSSQKPFSSLSFFTKVINNIIFQFQSNKKFQKDKFFYKAIQFGTSLMKYIEGDIQAQIQIAQVIKLFDFISTQLIYKLGKERYQIERQMEKIQQTFLFILTIANKTFCQCTDLNFINQFNILQKQDQLKQIIKQKLLKILGVFLFLPKTPPPLPSIIRLTIQLLSNLYNKIFRTKILSTKIFQNQRFVEILKKYNSKSSISQQILTFLQKFPFVFPVELRMERFRVIVSQDRNKFLYQNYGDQVDGKIIIRRGYQFIDAFDKLKNSNLKKRLQIVFVNDYGMKEIGIDAGGLSKQFLNRVLKSVLNPIYGMFIQNSQKQLFPHPQKAQLKGGIDTQYYEFIGKLLGKAIYQNITLGFKFSGPFLNAIVGKKNSFDDLNKIDPDLYKSLVYIKDMQEDASQLQLTFMYFDQIRKLPVLLKAKGNKIKVRNDNKKQYIHLLANYKVNRLLEYQCRYIKKGFSTIINKQWFTMFNYQELNYLISGTGIIDVQDMKAYSKLGGYNYNDQTIKHFWEVVREFSEQQKSKLLMFVTSCPRPSYLGFKDLSPPFTIVKTISDDIQTLPVSHTCSNVLQLPNYKDKQILKQKLKMAINSNSGFEIG